MRDVLLLTEERKAQNVGEGPPQTVSELLAAGSPHGNRVLRSRQDTRAEGQSISPPLIMLTTFFLTRRQKTNRFK